MKNCELLKEFHEKYPEFINLVEKFRNAILKKSPTNVNSCDMGTSIGEYSIRFKVNNNDHVCIQLCNNDFSLNYYSMFNDDINDKTIFYGTDFNAQIVFGNQINKEEFIICNDQFNKTMQYPITEEEYFQYSIAVPLCNEDVYEYFMNTRSEHPCDIQITSQGNGLHELKELLENTKMMNSLRQDIELICTAYKKTNGLVL